MSELQLPYIYWCLGLIVFVPLSIVVLNECIDRSRRGTNEFSDVLSMIRDIVLPLLVFVVLLRFVFVLSDQNLPAKFLSTVFWLALIVAVFRITRKIIGSGHYVDGDWRSIVPHMFLRLPPYTIMGFIVFHIIQNLWSFPVREMATTLGIGSIVIAFALQDTLSNLVSGILLVANSPFKTGDWVHVGDVEGRISAVNWRYTNIENQAGDLIVIPNGSISGESIENHSRPYKSTAVTQKFSLCYSHPPNKVKILFQEVFNNSPGILADPAPNIVVTNIDDPSMEYEAEYWIDDYGKKPDIHADFMLRVWYALQRHGISLPTQQYNIHTYNGLKYQAELHEESKSRKSCLDWLPRFSELPQTTRSALANASVLKSYAGNEIVVNEQEKESGVSVIVVGSIALDGMGTAGESAEKHTLHVGDFFGETGLFGRAVSPVTATALEDTEILSIPHDSINDAINRNPQFAAEFSSIIDQRRAQKERQINQANNGSSNISYSPLAEESRELQ